MMEASSHIPNSSLQSTFNPARSLIILFGISAAGTSIYSAGFAPPPPTNADKWGLVSVLGGKDPTVFVPLSFFETDGAEGTAGGGRDGEFRARGLRLLFCFRDLGSDWRGPTTDPWLTESVISALIEILPSTMNPFPTCKSSFRGIIWANPLSDASSVNVCCPPLLTDLFESTWFTIVSLKRPGTPSFPEAAKSATFPFF
mmetsp:Transcript_8363/g.20538  ORF Transcript_8363/g.20538 Transcript_8363/m.20538 type:complete len:200 (+) Transcript_8363:238-837(+)